MRIANKSYTLLKSELIFDIIEATTKTQVSSSIFNEPDPAYDKRLEQCQWKHG